MLTAVDPLAKIELAHLITLFFTSRIVDDRAEQPSNPPNSQDDSTQLTPKDRLLHQGESETAHYDAVLSDPHPIPSEEQRTVITKLPSGRTSLPKGEPLPIGEALEGTVLEHFTLEEFIGKGGMGAVYRATDTKLSRTVAVKVLSQNRTDSGSLRRFTNEAQSAARLDHPNIARVYYVGEDRGWHFIAFEYINGVNIRDLVEHKGPLPLEEAWSYVLQIADALVHASDRDVVHRDIKPSNILVTNLGTAKLVDMGLARLHHVENDDSDVTASGITLGTFDYISPEQARDPRGTDVRSDIYSLGCTLYYMLTGIAPYPTGTVLQKLLSHSSDPPPNPKVYRNDLDEGSIKILHKMLEKRPDDRYPKPADVINDIIQLAGQLGLQVDRVGRQWMGTRTATPFKWQTQLSWLVPIMALLVTTFSIHQINRPVADLVIAAPTFSTTPYQSPADPKVPNIDAGTQKTAPAAADHLQDQTETSTNSSDFQTVVVGIPENTLPDSMVAVNSLELAVSLLAEDEDIGAIEIWEDIEMPVEGLTLDLASNLNHPLVIRGKAEERPTLRITLSESSLETTVPAFIDVYGGQITFENLNINFTLPEEFRQGWSLFRLNGLASFNLIKSIITVLPPEDIANQKPVNVAVFDCVARTTDPESPDSTSPNAEHALVIDITDAFLRGPIQLLRNRHQFGVTLTWTNGLFISPDWLLSVTESTSNLSSIGLNLTNLTCYAGAGLLNFPVPDTDGFILGDLHFNDCIFSTELGNPLFVISHPVQETQNNVPLMMNGQNNGFYQSVVILEQHFVDDLGESEQFTLDQLNLELQTDTAPEWYNLKDSDAIVRWATPQVPPAGVPSHQQTIDHYRLDDFVEQQRGLNPVHPGVPD